MKLSRERRRKESLILRERWNLAEFKRKKKVVDFYKHVASTEYTTKSWENPSNVKIDLVRMNLIRDKRDRKGFMKVIEILTKSVGQ